MTKPASCVAFLKLAINFVKCYSLWKIVCWNNWRPVMKPPASRRIHLCFAWQLCASYSGLTQANFASGVPWLTGQNGSGLKIWRGQFVSNSLLPRRHNSAVQNWWNKKASYQTSCLEKVLALAPPLSFSRPLLEKEVPSWSRRLWQVQG